MAAEFDIVDVFVGTFDSKATLDRYLQEQFDDDEVPSSAFARDQGESFCDHDFLESTFRKSASSFSRLGAKLSFAEYWFDDAQAAFDAAGICRANALLLAFGETVERPRSASGEGYTLHYLGRFRHPSPAAEGSAGGDGPPAVCYLKIDGAKALVNGRPVSLVTIDAAGAIIGHGGSDDGGLCVDLPATDRPIAPRQARVYPNPSGQWVVEDLAGGDGTTFRGETLNQSKFMPWHEQTFVVGGIAFCWLAWER